MAETGNLAAGAAWMEGDILVISACTQAPVMDQEDTAKVLGLPLEKVRIIPAAAGGGFAGVLGGVFTQNLMRVFNAQPGPCARFGVAKVAGFTLPYFVLGHLGVQLGFCGAVEKVPF